MNLSLKKLAAAAVFVVAAYTPASADPGERVIEMVDACRDDYREFCPGVPPGGGRILSCLQDNKADLSPRCYKAFTVASAIRSCTPDYHALCSHVPPGEDRAVQCLGDHADEVSETCSRALTAALSLKLHRNEHTSAHGYREPPREYARPDEKRYTEEYRREEYRRYQAPARRDDRYDDEDEDPDTLK